MLYRFVRTGQDCHPGSVFRTDQFSAYNAEAMEKRRLQRFRAALEVRGVELRRNIAHLEEYARTKEDEAAADTLDRAGSSHSKDLLMRRIASERGLLRNVEAALQRIQGGTFGECVL